MPNASQPPRMMHVMAKPIGSRCNLDCTYCYYLDKHQQLAHANRDAMTPELLESFIRQYIQQQNGPQVLFSWQGGEPTLLGLDFFRRVVMLQQRYAQPGQQINNDLQTNGLLLNEEWAIFLKQHGFLVGLSIDGPQQLHDRHRRNRAGRGSFRQVMAAASLLHRHQIPFTTLTTVNADNAQAPLQVYRFLRDELGSPMMQFIPIVAKKPGLWLTPRQGDAACDPCHEDSPVEPWSVSAPQWGEFLCTLFDEWYRQDLGRHFVHYFEAAVAIWSGQLSSLCTLAPLCGKTLALEKDGALFSCDHFVEPGYQLGNIRDQRLDSLAFSTRQQHFGINKEATLPTQCRRCDYQFACFGECPKNRLLQTREGEVGLNYLCQGWHQFWSHIDVPMQQLVKRLGLPVQKGIFATPIR
jgi:uncharacterized protein